jgi:hypothetical protein
MKIINQISRYFQLRFEAQVLLRIVQPRIVQMPFDFNSNIEKNEIVWTFYALKSNYRKEAFWKRDRYSLSENEKAVRILLKYYSENLKDYKVKDDLQTIRFINRMINKYSGENALIMNSFQRERINL